MGVYCIIHYGEISLKGKNRPSFENKLVSNIKGCLKKHNLQFISLKKSYGRIIIELEKLTNTDNILTYTERLKVLKSVFGIVSFSVALKTSQEYAQIKEIVDFLLENKKFSAFRVTSSRADKTSLLKSYDYDKEIGAYIADTYNKRVSLEKFDLNINIELRDGFAYVFLDKIDCFGGLPVGIEGKALALIQDKKDILAALLAMKRGCYVVFLIMNDVDLSIVEQYNYGQKLKIIKISSITEIDEIAKKEHANAIVLGQSLENINKITSLTNLLPLIGMSDEEITNMMKMFGVGQS